MRSWCPLGIEPYLRDQRTTHFLILWGFEVPSTSSSLGKAQISLALLSLVRQFKAVRKTFQPRQASLAARKDRVAAVCF